MAQSTYQLPHDDAAEKACLGCALSDEKAANAVCSELQEEDFYQHKNRIIYRCIYNLIFNKNAKVDIVTVASELNNFKELENIGGSEYLQECIDSFVILGALHDYINSVLDNSVLRSLLATIRNIETNYQENEIENINDFILDAERGIRDSIEKRHISDFVTLKDRVDSIYQLINRKPSEGSLADGAITFGYDSLDNVTLGMRPGTTTVIAGRPGMGKSTFAYNVVYRIAAKTGKAVGIFALEMAYEDIYKRIISSESMVKLNKIDKGMTNADEKTKLRSTIDIASQLPIYIDDTRNAPIEEIIAKARKLANSEPRLGLLVIDHIGIIGQSKNGKKNENRSDEVRKLSHAIRALAGELKIPIIILCQVNRTLDKSESGEPEMSDLKESGALEEDADCVIFLHRKNKKSSKNKEEEQSEEDKQLSGLPNSPSPFKLLIRKNRHGNGRIDLPFIFYKDISRIEEMPSYMVEDYGKYEGFN